MSLAATAPQNFEATFTEQYGSQELNALPLDAGQSKDVKLKVRPPNTIGAGPYKVTAKCHRRGRDRHRRPRPRDHRPAEDRHCRPRGPAQRRGHGRAGDLDPGRSSTNTGTAPAEQIELSGTAPSGWKVEFEPKTIDRIAPNENKEVQALVTPTAKAVAGDYVTTVRAAARGESASQTFRVAVATSTHVGHRRHRHHRRRAADHGRRRGEVRPAMSDNVIEAQNLTKRYDGVPVVKGISFSVARGEIFGLLGPNGAGKTTTILMMLGLTDISDGQVRVLGLRSGARAARGQAPGRLSARPGRLLRQPDRGRQPALHRAPDRPRRATSARRRSRDALEHVGLPTSTDKRVATFSRGMRQRLGLAEILMKDAQIAILDEPTSGLDPQATIELLEIIRDLKHKGVTRAAVVASARPRAERLRPRRAVQPGQHRADRHASPELGRQVLGGGFIVEVEAEGQGLDAKLAAIPGVQRVETVGPEPLAAAVRSRRAAGGGGRGGRGRAASCCGCRSRSRASKRSTPAISSNEQEGGRHAA